MKQKISILSSLRFFAIMGIYFHHFDAFSLPTDNMLANVLFEGFVGVTFFFMLSGFVIAYAYEEKIKVEGVKPRIFIRQRFAKIWPLHIICLILASAL